MIDLSTIRTLLEYTDWSNMRLLDASLPLSDEHLDRSLEIGPGTLRKILIHTYNGEYVWLRRWRGEIETKWPSESEPTPVAALIAAHATNNRERDAYLARVFDADLAKVQPYRDSKGNLFHVPLGEMFMQGVMHSKHHQAQACNALRRLGAQWPELDYMMRIRKPG